jgi:hypothetical protein
MKAADVSKAMQAARKKKCHGPNRRSSLGFVFGRQCLGNDAAAPKYLGKSLPAMSKSGGREELGMGEFYDFPGQAQRRYTRQLFL